MASQTLPVSLVREDGTTGHLTTMCVRGVGGSVERGNGVRKISTHPVSSTEQTRKRIKVKAEPGERGCERE